MSASSLGQASAHVVSCSQPDVRTLGRTHPSVSTSGDADGTADSLS